MNSIRRYTLCSFSLLNLSIILVLCITISTRNEADAERSFTNNIIANFKDRICSSPKYAGRFTMCKDYLKEDQTTSPPLEMNLGNDMETVTLQVVSEAITQTLQESETKLDAVTNLGRLGVIMSRQKYLCQLMSSGALEYGEFVEEIGWRLYYM